jgi:hypothetical protein
LTFHKNRLALVGDDHLLVIEVIVMIGEGVAVDGICATTEETATAAIPAAISSVLYVFIFGFSLSFIGCKTGILSSDVRG